MNQNLIFVDVEATGITPYSGQMTEFGAVHYGTRGAFHGRLFDSVPDTANPAKPVITGVRYPQEPVMPRFANWIAAFPGRAVFVSDNPAYDLMWIAYYFDKHLGHNPFGHSGRRINDFWAGLKGDWTNTQKWKKLRSTPHDHNPVSESMDNVEAFEAIGKLHNLW